MCQARPDCFTPACSRGQPKACRQPFACHSDHSFLPPCRVERPSLNSLSAAIRHGADDKATKPFAPSGSSHRSSHLLASTKRDSHPKRGAMAEVAGAKLVVVRRRVASRQAIRSSPLLTSSGSVDPGCSIRYHSIVPWCIQVSLASCREPRLITVVRSRRRTALLELSQASHLADSMHAPLLGRQAVS